MLLYVLVLAALLGCVPGAIAQSKGHDFVPWWLYGMAIFIVALPHSLMLKPDRGGLDGQALAAGGRRCPFCAEIVREEATVCRFCRRDLPPAPTAAAPRYLARYQQPAKPDDPNGRRIMIGSGVALAMLGVAALILVSRQQVPTAASSAEAARDDYAAGFKCDRSLARAQLVSLIAAGSLRARLPEPQVAVTTLTLMAPAARWNAMAEGARQRLVAAVDCAYAGDDLHLQMLKIYDQAGHPLAKYSGLQLIEVRTESGPRAPASG